LSDFFLVWFDGIFCGQLRKKLKTLYERDLKQMRFFSIGQFVDEKKIRNILNEKEWRKSILSFNVLRHLLSQCYIDYSDNNINE